MFIYQTAGEGVIFESRIKQIYNQVTQSAFHLDFEGKFTQSEITRILYH